MLLSQLATPGGYGRDYSVPKKLQALSKWLLVRMATAVRAFSAGLEPQLAAVKLIEALQTYNDYFIVFYSKK